MSSLKDSRCISVEEWDARRSRITELYITLGYPLKGPNGVIETMKKERFAATIAQYEHQFRKWGLRKNKRQVGQTSTILGTQQGGGMSQRPSAPGGIVRQPPRQVVFWEDQPASHNAAQVEGGKIFELNSEMHTMNAGTDMVATGTDIMATMTGSDLGVGPVEPHRDVEPSTETTDNWNAADADMFMVDQLSAFNAPWAPSNLQWSPPNSFSGGISSITSLQLNDPFWSIEQSLSHFLSNELLYARPNLPELPLPTVSYSRHDWLRNPLPSPQLAAMFINRVYIQSSTTYDSGSLTGTGDSNVLFRFMNIVAESNPNFGPFAPIRARRGVPRALTILYDLTSRETFAGEEWSYLASLSDGASSEALFDARLIASTINAFAGLEDIPAAGVIRFLHRHPTVQWLMLNFFSDRSSLPVKSFLENAFLAYIEADNDEAIITLLHSRSFDANTTVCHRHGERYTPLEYAAKCQSFKVLRQLIMQGVDVNKSFKRRYQSNALSLLVMGVDDFRPTLTEGFMNSLNYLLSAKATISTETIEKMLRFPDSDLALRALKTCASQTPQKLISEGSLLHSIMRVFDERNATEIIQLAIDNCLESSESGYLDQAMWDVTWALKDAIGHGYDQLAESLLQYMAHSRQNLWELIELRNRSVLAFLLKKHLDPNDNLKLGTDIDSDRDSDDSLWDTDSSRDTDSDGYTDSDWDADSDQDTNSNQDDDPDQETEASDIPTFSLMPEDENELCSLISTGDPSNLQASMFGQALSAALRAGDLERATKLLELDPDLEFYQCMCKLACPGGMFKLDDALRDALTHNFDDIAWKILAIGLTVLTSSDLLHRHIFLSLLHVSIKQSRPAFVNALIEFGIPSFIQYKETQQRILEAAIKCPEITIFDNLFRAIHRPIHPTDRLYKLVLDEGRQELFLDIFKSSVQDQAHQYQALKAAVRCGDELALGGLLSIGVPADNEKILVKAFKKRPLMVGPLLDHFFKAYPEGRAGYGKRLVQKALDKHPKSPQLIDMVFDRNLVTINVKDGAYSEKPTFLLTAVRRCDCDLVQRLISVGSNVNTVSKADTALFDNSTTTALLDAIDKRSYDVVQLLINNGANVNESLHFGLQRTPLQKAAEMNDIPIVRLLLQNNAEVNAAPAKFLGATALQLAAIHGNCEMATILIEHGARQDICPPDGLLGRYPIEGAAENGRFDMIELLWNAHPGPFNTKQCQKAMRLAEKNGHIACKEKIKELTARHAQTPMLLG